MHSTYFYSSKIYIALKKTIRITKYTHVVKTGPEANKISELGGSFLIMEVSF